MADGTWEQDPTGRHELRWRDQQGWTGHVADAGEVAFDDGPVPTQDGPPPVPSAAGETTTGASGGTAGGAGSAPASSAASDPGDGWGAPLRVETPATGGPSSQAPPSWPAPQAGGGVTTSSSSSSSGGGWSTGAKVAAWIGGIVLLVGSWGIGFVMGAASEVTEGFSEAFQEGFEGEFDTGDADLSGPTAGTLAPGDRVSGSGQGDVVIYDLQAPGGTIEVEVLDADFDTILELYDAAGDRVARDDDGGDGFNSLLRTDVPSGTYTLVVDAFGGAPDGPFELEVR